MAGNSNSGCRPKSQVQKRRDSIQRSWILANDVLENGRVLTNQQFELVKIIIAKSIPEETLLGGDMTITHKVAHQEIAERLQKYMVQ